MSQVPAYNVTVEQAKTQLAKLKESQAYHFEFLVNANNASMLPPWVKSAKRTTDGRLAELAKSNGCVLATLDENIAGAFVIPS